MPRTVLVDAALVFWDFDGVIKESLEIKAQCFERLFLPFGELVATRVRSHHDAHGGMSRFDKVPLYLHWAGQPVTPERVQDYCDRFGAEVRQSVIDSPWVPGVESYLRGNCDRQTFVLVSATPQGELLEIVEALSLRSCFRGVQGAPTRKATAIATSLADLHIPADRCLMVGDAEADVEAARVNGVPFLLRATQHNSVLQKQLPGRVLSDFSE